MNRCERGDETCNKSIAKESPRGHTARRVAAAGMALAAVLTLGACKATGGGQIDDPVPSGSIPVDVPFEIGDGAFTGDANFGFNFTCEMTAKNKAVIKGQITYHDTGTSEIEGVDFRPIRLHGVVDPMFITAPETARRRPRSSSMRPSSRAPTGPRKRA